MNNTSSPITPSFLTHELANVLWLDTLLEFFDLSPLEWRALDGQLMTAPKSILGKGGDSENESTSTASWLECNQLFYQFWARINFVGYSHEAVQELVEGWLSLYVRKTPMRVPLSWINTFGEEIKSRLERTGLAPLFRKIIPFLAAVITESTLRFERLLQHNAFPPEALYNNMLSTEDFLQAFYADRTNHTKSLTAILLIDIEVERVVFRVNPVLVNGMLAEVVQRVNTVLNSGDKIAYYSKYDLAVLLPQLASVNQATQSAAAILKLIEKPFVVGDQEFRLRPTIGIAVAPDHSRDAHELIGYAQLAALEARTLRERFALFVPDQAQLARRESALEDAFYKALDSNLLVLHFQPQVEIKTGMGSAAEALLRWQVSSGDWVPPGRIIAIAERLGLEATLTSWLLNAACQALSQFLRDGVDLSLSVNLTTIDLKTAYLPDLIKKCLETWQVPAEKLTLEITEEAMIVDQEQVLQVLLALREIGVKLAIDDFGTGYSSLAYLKNLPVDELKIDQIFVRRLLHSEADRHIVRSMIYLARGFGLKVVAEGAEDMATVNLLKLFECDVIQGYAYSPPLPFEVFKAWWHERHLPH